MSIFSTFPVVGGGAPTEDGGYYSPIIDDEGNLRFTASKDNMPQVSGANIRGPAGKSAYTAATEAGFTGTELEFNNAMNAIPSHIADQNNPHVVTPSQIGAVPQTRTINKKPLSEDVTLTGEDIKVTGSDETTIHTRLSEITNPNLLDNWYFGNPVNQRAASEYSGSWSYCIDRWVAEGIITVGKEGVSASSRDASNPAYFLQRFEHFPDGRQVTFSLLTDNKLYAITGVKNGEMGFSKTFDDGVILSVEHGTPVYAAVSFPPGKTYQMIATKLEFGSQQTLAHQENGKWVLNEIPDYGEQLAKCQRYYCTSYQNGPVGTPEKYLNEIVMTAISQINFSTREIQFPQTMRTTPAITFYSPVTGKVGKAAKAGGGEVDIKEMIGGKNRMSFFCSSNNLDIGYEYYVHYSASADL